MSFRIGILKSVVAAALAALMFACAGAKGEIESQYAKIDSVVNMDNAAAVLKVVSEDFVLTYKGGESPGGTFIFDGVGQFYGKDGKKKESVRQMGTREYYLRQHGAAQSGDKFETVVNEVNVSGDTATAKATRTQTKRAASQSRHIVAQIIYTSEDQWKKQGEEWRMTASDLKNVEFKEVK